MKHAWTWGKEVIFISKTDDKMSEGFIGYKEVKQSLYQVQTFTVKLLKRRLIQTSLLMKINVYAHQCVLGDLSAALLAD